MQEFNIQDWIKEHRLKEKGGKFWFNDLYAIQLTSQSHMKVWIDDWVVYFGRVPKSREMLESILELLEIKSF